MAQISVILASRDRLELLKQAVSTIRDTSSFENVEVLVATDEDDNRTKSAVIDAKIFTRERSDHINRDYINWLLSYTTGKYVIAVHDDVVFTNKNWDKLALEKLEIFTANKPDGVVYAYNDLSFPLLSRNAIGNLGFVFPNERHTWGADRDLFNMFVSMKNYIGFDRMLHLPELGIQHNTYRNKTRHKDHINSNVEDIFSRTNVFSPIGFQTDKFLSNLKKNPDEGKKEILVVYNICGISKRENYHYYLIALNGLLAQNGNFRVVVSGCSTSEDIKKLIHENIGDKVSYNWIDEKYPLNFTFNYTVEQSIKQFGAFEGYLYVDCGINMQHDRDIILKLQKRLKNYAMVTAKVDSDDGYINWGLDVRPNEDYVIPLGRAANLHCQLFSHELYANYGKILPDIFAHDTSESVYTFLCSAIKKKWVIAHDVIVHHNLFLDGPSSGFRGKHDILYRSNKSILQICLEGSPLGFGYEEIQNVCNHDDRLFEDGFPKNSRLLHFLRNNMFCEYGKVNHFFIPQKKYEIFPLPSPKITCIVVSHQKAQYCNEAIQSILNQDMQDYQVIVMDSGKLYNEGYFNWIQDPRFTIIPTGETEELRRSRAMAPWCFNEAFRRGLVKGELIIYLCDDDILYSNCFSTFVNYAEKNPEAYAMYASQDLVTVGKGITGERRALHTIGWSCREFRIICRVDYLQFCHRRSIMGAVWWSETLDGREDHKDGIFMDEIGQNIQIHAIDLKVSQNRRCELSTYCPVK